MSDAITADRNRADMSRAELEARLTELESENARLRTASPRDVEVADLLGHLPIALVVHRGGPPVYANAAMAALVGVTLDEYMDSVPALGWVHDKDRLPVTTYVERCMAGQEAPASGEFRMRRADGSTMIVDSHTTRVIWNGEPAVISALIDISARHDAERELRQSRRLFQSIFNATPDVVTVTDLETGCLVDVNNAFLRHTIHDRDTVVGGRPAEFGIFGDAMFREGILREVGEHNGVENRETVAHTVDGDRIFTISAEVLEVGRSRLMLTIGRDITEWRRQEAELRQSKQAAERANRAKSEFLASMSHELRTPLNAIIGFSEVIRDAVFGPISEARYTDYANDINESGQHLLQIINDLLDLTKLEAGKFELTESTVAPQSVVDACLRLVSARADNSGLKLVSDLADELPPVCGDARLLKQILINLLSNAVKFTPRGGTVTVAAAVVPDGGLSLSVADTGVGMSAAEIEIALTPFGQVDGVLNRKHQGTGLGLPLARSLAELHGGTMAIESEPGTGTTVTVTLPPERVFHDPEPDRAAGAGR